MADLPPSLARQPRLNQWLHINKDNSVTIRTGKVELGQGILTAIRAIAAEELDMEPDQIQVETVDTRFSPNEMITAGSLSIETSGQAVRVVCAEVRQLLISKTAQILNVAADTLYMDRGYIRAKDSNRSRALCELADDELLDQHASGLAPLKAAQDYRVVGRKQSRLDLRGKITGASAFIQDDSCSGLPLLHARIVRPPRFHDELIASHHQSVADLSEVHSVVVDGNLIAILATSEYAAVRGQERLINLCEWRSRSEPIPADIPDFLRQHADVSLLLDGGTPTDAPVPAPIRSAEAEHLSASYNKPYHMHASLSPSAARAWLQDNELFVESHSQGPYILQMALAQSLNMEAERVHVRHRENAGCYGHNGADDAAMDAALLATHLPGYEILLKWSRQDECRWEPYSPAMTMDMCAGLKDGQIVCWNADIYSQSHGGRPAPFGSVSNLISAWQKTNPQPRAESRPGYGPHSGIHRNADPYYDFPVRRVTKNLVKSQVVRTSSTRGLGAYGNVFAIESFMDELAHASGVSPVEFRLAHLSDPRARAVLTEAWSMSMAHPLPHNTGDHVFGRGIAFARYKNLQSYAAVAVQIEVDNSSAEVRLVRADIAADVGQVIDADGVSNQLEGGFIQSASWTLKEAVRLSADGSTSVDWDTYPILRFEDIPPVEVKLLDQPQLPPLGAGEATQGPTPAAIANAVYAATRLRLRDIPFTPDQVRAAAMRDDHAPRVEQPN